MDSFQFAKEVEAEVKLFVAMTKTDNWRRSCYLRTLRLKSFREVMKSYREDSMRRVEWQRAEAFTRRDASNRKAKEELIAKEAKRIKEQEATEVAELLQILKEDIDNDEGEPFRLGDTSKRKAEEELTAKEAKRMKKEEAVEMDIEIKEDIGNDERKAEEELTAEEAAEIRVFIDSFKEDIDEIF